MFSALSSGLSKVFEKLNRKGVLTEDDINSAVREIRISLIEADVALPVIRSLVEKIKVRALGAAVLSSLTPGQVVVKIVHDEIIDILKSEQQTLKINAAIPVIVLIAGLQGAGKTTTAAKLGLRLRQKHKKRVLLASTDTSRPAAQKQLEVLGKEVGIDTLPIISEQGVLDITKRAISESTLGNFDVLIIDTAGRMSVDLQLMDELKSIHALCKPQEALLVADCMMGQDSLNIAQSFQATIPLTGIVLTKVDGDARGGAALSMKFITGCPIKFIGIGEKSGDLEEFRAESVASRILNMGDVVTLVEKMHEIMDEKQSESLSKKMQKGKIDMNDLLSQMKHMKKLGGIGSLLGMIPGLGQIKQNMENLRYGEKMFAKQQAIIHSMTALEKSDPTVINSSRKCRIANGSGTTVADVNRLLKQHLEMNNMMKKMSKMKPDNLKKFGTNLVK